MYDLPYNRFFFHSIYSLNGMMFCRTRDVSKTCECVLSWICRYDISQCIGNIDVDLSDVSQNDKKPKHIFQSFETLRDLVLSRLAS